MNGNCGEERFYASFLLWLYWNGASTDLKKGMQGAPGTVAQFAHNKAKFGFFLKPFISSSFYLLRYHADYTILLQLLGERRDTSHSCRSNLPTVNTFSLFKVLNQSPLKSMERLPLISLGFGSELIATIWQCNRSNINLVFYTDFLFEKTENSLCSNLPVFNSERIW